MEVVVSDLVTGILGGDGIGLEGEFLAIHSGGAAYSSGVCIFVGYSKSPMGDLSIFVLCMLAQRSIPNSPLSLFLSKSSTIMNIPLRVSLVFLSHTKPPCPSW